MKWLKRLGRHFWAIWGLLYFIAVAIILFPLTYLSLRIAPQSRKFDVGMNFTRIWSKILLYGMAMPLRVKNEHIVQENKPCIIVTNHVSQLDILACAATIPINFKYLSKKEVTRIPVVGYLTRQLHVIVDRKSKESREASIKEMALQVRLGHTLNIYPEGTRNKGPALLKSFYDGAFRLAVHTQRPLVPMTILNNWHRENQHTKVQLNPGPIEVVFDEPIVTEGCTMQDLPALKQQVMDKMKARLQPVHGTEYSLP